MTFTTRYLSFYDLAKRIHDSGVSPKTGHLDETDEHLVFLHLFAYVGML